MALGSSNSIFQTGWWLDAVAPEMWDEVSVEQSGEVLARMPFVLQKSKLGLVYIGVPQLTQTLGPWIMQTTGKESSRLSTQKKLCTELVGSLPDFDYFQQSFHYSITNWLPFYWAGFKQTTNYTYVVEGLKDLDKVYAQFDSAKRRDIKKAGKIVTVVADMPAKEFYEHHKKSLEKNGDLISYDFPLFSRVYDSALEHDAGKTFYSLDSDGAIHAAIFVIWTSKSAHFLISSVDPEYRNSGSLSLLIWEAMKFCVEFTDNFDFDGSMIKNAEHSYRSFGGIQKPYSVVSKMSRRMEIFQTGKSLMTNSRSLMTRK